MNEADNLPKLVRQLRQNSCPEFCEIIIADGGSTDNTIEVADGLGLKVVACEKVCRASQMNRGAAEAIGNCLYFVHADTLPPITFVEDIKQALSKGFKAGCYRSQFDKKSLGLKLKAYLTRFNKIWFRGGDQTLFITKKLFEQINGFNEVFTIMEDYEIIERVKKYAGFKVMPGAVLISSRKYQSNNYFRVNFANFIVFVMYFIKKPPGEIKETYFRLIKHPKAIS